MPMYGYSTYRVRSHNKCGLKSEWSKPFFYCDKTPPPASLTFTGIEKVEEFKEYFKFDWESLRKGEKFTIEEFHLSKEGTEEKSIMHGA